MNDRDNGGTVRGQKSLSARRPNGACVVRSLGPVGAVRRADLVRNDTICSVGDRPHRVIRRWSWRRVAKRTPRTRRQFWVAYTAAVVASIIFAPDAQSQNAGPASGYEIIKSPQSVQNAPPGWVGRKTTDVERRVGNTEQTKGNETTFVLTIGGFARRCPSAEGIVEGNYEYALTREAVVVTGGVRQQTRHARRASVSLKGQVGANARLEYVDLEGSFTSETSGTGVPASSERRPLRARFTPGAGGEPDWSAMIKVAELSGDLGAAANVLYAGALYKMAEAEWTKVNECVEFTFDPPSKTRTLAPDDSAQVRVSLRTKQGSTLVAWETEHINVLQAGSVSPKPAKAPRDAPATLKYTASSRPRRGDGFGLTTLSRAGVGEGEWRIIEPAKFDGKFTQIDSFNMGTGLGIATNVEKVTGALVWTPEEEELPSLPTFGDVRSSFFRPSAGEFLIEIDYRIDAPAESGMCKHHGRKSFPLASLPKDMLRYFLLEIAEDGRYKLSLGLTEQVWQVWKMSVDTVCTFPTGHVTRDTVPVKGVAVQLGWQHGTLNPEHGVVGKLAAPIRRGPRTITGDWSFASKTD